MLITLCALVFSSEYCLLCQWVVSPPLHSLLLTQDIWFHIKVLINLVLSIVNRYQYESICILLNTDLDKSNWLKSISFINFKFLALLYKSNCPPTYGFTSSEFLIQFLLSIFLILWQYPSVFITGILVTKDGTSRKSEKINI